jgi:ribulose-5-phosphate 4-epimerase/fuculose-1-phosphate aldolase
MSFDAAGADAGGTHYDVLAAGPPLLSPRGNMAAPNNPSALSRADASSAEEWAARVQLAAAYRIFHLLGWTELIYNHISLRLPGAVTHFLINPFGLHYSEVTASNLLKIDLKGNIIGRADRPFNPAGFTPHATIHAGLPGAHCVMHTHTTAGMGVACLEEGLSMSNFYSAQLHGKVAYHAFEGITVHEDEGPRLLKSIGGKPAVILRNHGLLAWGDTVPSAFAVLWLLQRACEIQLATQSMGSPRLIPEDIQRRCTADSLQFDPRFGAGRDVFEALTRQIDRIDPSYRT